MSAFKNCPINCFGMYQLTLWRQSFPYIVWAFFLTINLWKEAHINIQNKPLLNTKIATSLSSKWKIGIFFFIYGNMKWPDVVVYNYFYIIYFSQLCPFWTPLKIDCVPMIMLICLCFLCLVLLNCSYCAFISVFLFFILIRLLILY